MRRSRRVATAGVAALMLFSLGACSKEADADTSHARTALTWLEHLCNGRYAAAQDRVSPQRHNERRYLDLDADLEQAEVLATARLDELRAEGVDVEPDLTVESSVLTENETEAEVTISGSCFGETFEKRIDLIKGGEDWFLMTPLPIINQTLTVDDGAMYPYVKIDIPTGQYLHNEDPGRTGWLLPPGEHTIHVPGHFVTGGPQEVTMTTSLFEVVEAAPGIATTSERLDAALKQFSEKCGNGCFVEGDLSEGHVTFTSELTPTSYNEEGEYEFDGPGFVIDIVPDLVLRNVHPTNWNPWEWTDWADEPEGARASPAEARTAFVTPVECPSAGACSHDPRELSRVRQEISTFEFVEVDGEVRLTGVTSNG